MGKVFIEIPTALISGSSGQLYSVMHPVIDCSGRLRLRRQAIKNVKVLRITFDHKTAHSRNGTLKGGEYVGILMHHRAMTHDLSQGCSVASGVIHGTIM